MPPPPRCCAPVPASPRTHVDNPPRRSPVPLAHGPDPRRPGSPSPHHPRSRVLAPVSRISLRLVPTHLFGYQFSRSNAPGFLCLPPPTSHPSCTATSRRPRPRAHVPKPRGDKTSAAAVKWPGGRPRRTRLCARSPPGRALERSIRTVAVILQALDPVREEEGGKVLWRRRILRSVLNLRAENERGTESRQYPSSIRVRKPARRNSVRQGVGSAARARWGYSCSGAGARAVARHPKFDIIADFFGRFLVPYRLT